MSPEPVAADRAYLLFKTDILSGRFSPGRAIIERVVAIEYGVSISPIRDAAQRLVGEHLLEIGTGGGFRVPIATPAAVRDLYSWHDHLVRHLIKVQMPTELLTPKPWILRDIVGGEKIARAATGLFRALADQAVNREHARSLHAANDRLQAIRLREHLVMDNLDMELQQITAAINCGSGLNRFSVLRAYHRRRMRRAEKISDSLRSLG
ncbi:GntR family transcriptional regulator [Sphingobium sp. MK2]|uniref:GntR family transcriptional regulator n=1 Tax=Sphingobium sp. MK2 TaxID=3116540 RepID=UPI0032E3665B